MPFLHPHKNVLQQLFALCFVLVSTTAFKSIDFLEYYNQRISQAPLHPLSRLEKEGDKIVLREDPNGYETRYRYHLNQQLAEILYTSSQVEFTYNNAGLLTSYRDTSGTTRFDYDAKKNLIQKVFPNGETVSFVYNAQGFLTEMKIPFGSFYYQYDSTGNLSLIQDPQGRQTSFIYDSQGKRRHVILPSGMAVAYSYNAKGAIRWISYYKPSGAWLMSFSYTYNSKGQIVFSSDNPGSGGSAFQYDAQGRLVRALYPDKTAEAFDYPTDGKQRIVHTNRSGVEEPYTYNAAGELESAGDLLFELDANGNRILCDDGHGRIDYTFDPENRLASAQTTTSRYTAKFTPGWNHLALQMPPDNPDIRHLFRNFVFGRDILQILRYSRGQFERFAANPATDAFEGLEYGRGYFIYVTHPNGLEVSLTGKNSHQEILSLAAGWNLIGTPYLNPTSIMEAFKDFLAEKTLLEILRVKEGGFDRYSKGEFDTLEPNHVYYVYASRPLVWKISPSRHFLIQNAYNALGERIERKEGNTLSRFFFVGGQRLYEKNETGELAKIYTWGPWPEEVFYETDASGKALYTVRDLFGHTRARVDEKGAIVARYNYTASGENLNGGEEDGQCFSGGEFEPLLGLYYLNGRWYDPRTGVYLSRDPESFDYMFEPKPLFTMGELQPAPPVPDPTPVRNPPVNQDPPPPAQVPSDRVETIRISIPPDATTINGSFQLSPNATIETVSENFPRKTLFIHQNRFLIFGMNQEKMSGGELVFKLKVKDNQEVRLNLEKVSAASSTATRLPSPILQYLLPAKTPS